MNEYFARKGIDGKRPPKLGKRCQKRLKPATSTPDQSSQESFNSGSRANGIQEDTEKFSLRRSESFKQLLFMYAHITKRDISFKYEETLPESLKM